MQEVVPASRTVAVQFEPILATSIPRNVSERIAVDSAPIDTHSACVFRVKEEGHEPFRADGFASRGNPPLLVEDPAVARRVCDPSPPSRD